MRKATVSDINTARQLIPESSATAFALQPFEQLTLGK